MMTQAFYTGINGIQTHQYGIDVISDNLANISTVGFRGSSAEFASLFEKSMNTANSSSSITSSIGVGTRLNATVMSESSGSYKLSDKSTDLAIMGDGWFGIQGGEGEPMYTRDGTFFFDENRDLVTGDGYYVLGTMGENIQEGELTQKLTEIGLKDADAQTQLRFPDDLHFPVEPTTEVGFLANLGVEDATRVISTKAIDAQSNTNKISLKFTKVQPQVEPGSQWNVEATAQSLSSSSEYDPQTGETNYIPDEIYDTQTGVVEFDASGALLTNTLPPINNNGSEVTINLGTGYDGVTASQGAFVSSSFSNGKEAGDLVGYDINKNGEVVATFTNGEQSSVGAIAIYHFMNDQALNRVNGARFQESVNSGEAIFFQDANGKNIAGAEIFNYRLEGSNVKTEVAMTDLIIMQRAYDANSKSVTTADEMMKKALEMDA